jgi:hypothetical protein
VVDGDTLEEVVTVAGDAAGQGSLRLLIAAQVGPVRLIDNSGVTATADVDRAVPQATERVRQLERIG